MVNCREQRDGKKKRKNRRTELRGNDFNLKEYTRLTSNKQVVYVVVMLPQLINTERSSTVFK